MRSWKRLIAMALAGVLTVGCAAGCAGASEQTENGSAAASSDTKQPIITVMTNSMGGKMQHMLQAGAILQGQELGYTINILAPNNAANTQEVLDDLAAAQTYSDAIVFMPNYDTMTPEEESTQAYLNQIIPALSDVKSAGTPVIMMSYSLDDDTLCDTFVGTNNYRLGRALGETIAENQPNAVVGILQADSLSKSLKVREKGLTEALRENGCTVLEDEAVGNWDGGTGTELAAAMLENHPEMTTIVCTSEAFVQFAFKAVRKAMRVELVEEETGEQILPETEQQEETEDTAQKAEFVQIYATDSSTSGFNSVIDGSVKAEVFENPMQIGRDSITLADQLLNGQTVKKINRTPYVLVTQENAQALKDAISEGLAQAGLTS